MPKEKDPPLKSSRTINLQRLLLGLDAQQAYGTLDNWIRASEPKIQDLSKPERIVFDAAIERKKQTFGKRRHPAPIHQTMMEGETEHAIA